MTRESVQALLVALSATGIAAVLLLTRKKAAETTTDTPRPNNVIPWPGSLPNTDPIFDPIAAAWEPPAIAFQWLQDFQGAEYRYNLPDGLLGRMAQAESAFNPSAVSPAGAIGLMQIIPRWHPDVDPTDPIASIWYAGRYMRELHNQFKTWPLALAGYNWGPGNLKKYLDNGGTMPLETRNYIAAIGADIALT